MSKPEVTLPDCAPDNLVIEDITVGDGEEAVAAVVALPLVLPPTVLGFYLLLLLGPDELLLLLPPLLVVGPAFPSLLLDVLVGPPAPPLLLDVDVSLLLLDVGDGSALLLVR